MNVTLHSGSADVPVFKAALEELESAVETKIGFCDKVEEDGVDKSAATWLESLLKSLYFA